MLCSTPLPGLAGRLLMAGCCRPGFDLSGHFALTQGVQVMIRELMQERGEAPYCRGGVSEESYAALERRRPDRDGRGPLMSVRVAQMP